MQAWVLPSIPSTHPGKLFTPRTGLTKMASTSLVYIFLCLVCVTSAFFWNDVTDFAEKVASEIKGTFTDIDVQAKCKDYKDSVECCFHMEMEKLNIDEDVCFSATLLPEKFALDMKLKVNDKVVSNSVVSAKNPQICAAIPLTKKLVGSNAGICLGFTDLTIIGNSFSGCSHLSIEFFNMLVKKFKLGCFAGPSKYAQSGHMHGAAPPLLSGNSLLLKQLAMSVAGAVIVVLASGRHATTNWLLAF